MVHISISLNHLRHGVPLPIQPVYHLSRIVSVEIMCYNCLLQQLYEPDLLLYDTSYKVTYIVINNWKHQKRENCFICAVWFIVP